MKNHFVDVLSPNHYSLFIHSLFIIQSLLGTLVVVKIQQNVRQQSLQFHTHVC